MSEAGELIKGGHYAAAHVRGVAARLDKAWKEFAGGLDERTTVLALSVMFHQKAEQVSIFTIRYFALQFMLFKIGLFHNIQSF